MERLSVLLSEHAPQSEGGNIRQEREKLHLINLWQPHFLLWRLGVGRHTGRNPIRQTGHAFIKQ